MRQSLVLLSRRMPELADELTRLADSLDAGAPSTLADIRALIAKSVTRVCLEENLKVEVRVGEQRLATTTAMLDRLVESSVIPRSLATPLKAVETGELTLTGDAGRALVTFLEWRIGSRSRRRRPRRRSSARLLVALALAIAAVLVVTIYVATRSERRVLVAGETVTIRGGTFDMGSHDDELQAALELCRNVDRRRDCETERLQTESLRTVTVSTFEIDRHEVTVGEFVGWLNRTKVEDVPIPNIDRAADGTFSVQEKRARLPAVGMTWTQAQAYCEAVGRRLPTEAEWELAARGTERRTFPWGKRAPTCDEVVYGRRIERACEVGGYPQEPAIVETAALDVTPDGVHDLGGNVSEWTSDTGGLRPRCPGPCVDPRISTGEPTRVVRGGNWGEYVVWLRTAGRNELQHDHARTHIGFRCARTVIAR